MLVTMTVFFLKTFVFFIASQIVFADLRLIKNFLVKIIVVIYGLVL